MAPWMHPTRSSRSGWRRTANNTPARWLAGASCALAFATWLGASTTASAERRHCWDCDIPFGWEDGNSFSDNPPLPEGFVLTVQVGASHSGSSPASSALDRYSDVARALGACWDPAEVVGAGRWGAVTLRASFKRDGTINGVPRVVALSPEAEPAKVADLKASLMAALSRCTPLHFTPALGNAIAGQIFAIRFVQQG